MILRAPYPVYVGSPLRTGLQAATTRCAGVAYARERQTMRETLQNYGIGPHGYLPP